MEKKVNGEIIERLGNGEVLSFTIKSMDKTYHVSNCHSVPSFQDTENEKRCYSGNVDLEIENVTRQISARLWVSVDSDDCVLVYDI